MIAFMLLVPKCLKEFNSRKYKGKQIPINLYAVWPLFQLEWWYNRLDRKPVKISVSQDLQNLSHICIEDCLEAWASAASTL